ncbi:hypothetical protein NP233_g11622 [Leucocoprinus birnbaumii]|uniref:Uncharacterized protein n=1 Tax=Leucocoprinus birnbaumii TaxID=56174 RepID=A0AAD5YNS7_9AGAR|nr:hypothetical protein NP233_g11622 [Leucocoprinus birnbaumii]
MMEWWNDIRMLCARYLIASEQIERSGPVEHAVRSAGYGDLSEEEEGSSVEEEEEYREMTVVDHDQAGYDFEKGGYEMGPNGYLKHPEGASQRAQEKAPLTYDSHPSTTDHHGQGYVPDDLRLTNTNGYTTHHHPTEPYETHTLGVGSIPGGYGTPPARERASPVYAARQQYPEEEEEEDEEIPDEEYAIEREHQAQRERQAEREREQGPVSVMLTGDEGGYGETA